MIPAPMAVGRIARTVRTRFAAKARSSGQGVGRSEQRAAAMRRGDEADARFLVAAGPSGGPVLLLI